MEDGNEEGQPRPNVMFELGWFAGKYGRSRTLMIVKQGTKIPSDLYGIQVIYFNKDISEKIPDLQREIDAWMQESTHEPNPISGLESADSRNAGLQQSACAHVCDSLSF